MVLKVARRYANAFLQVAIEQEVLDTTVRDVRDIHETIEASRELKLFLRSPVIKPEEKQRALDSIFGEQIEPLTGRFLELVIDKGRERLLDQIMVSFIDLYKLHAGIIDVELYSAMELEDDTVADLKAALQKKTGKKVDLQIFQRPELIGGVAVKIDDTIIDGSLSHKLDRLKSLLKEAAI